MKGLLAALALAATTSAQAAPLGTIETVAGGGVGDGLLATSVPLVAPQGVAVDSAGNVFIAEADRGRVRKVAPNGVISTVFTGPQYNVGGYFPLYYWGPASCPGDMAIDAADNVYFADRCAHVVRRIEAASGTVSVVAGKGFHLTPLDPSGDGGAATASTLYFPTHIAVDSAGNLFITEPGRRRIRKVSGDVISTFLGGSGGSSTSVVAGPIAADGAGGIYAYLSDPYPESRYRVQRIDAAGTMTAVAGNGTNMNSGDGGAALAAGIAAVQGMALDASGDLVLTFSDQIRRVRAGTIDRLASFGAGDVALAGAALLVTTAENRVLRVVPPAASETVAGTAAGVVLLGDGKPALEATLSNPAAAVADRSGVLYIADAGHHRIRRVGLDGVMSTFAGNGVSGYAGDGGPATAAQLADPVALALDDAGNLYVADRGNHRIRRIAANGVITTIAGTGVAGFSGDGGPAVDAQLSQPAGIALDAAGNLYIADFDNERVRRLAPDGIITTVAGGGTGRMSAYDAPRDPLTLYIEPLAVAVDGAGNLFFISRFPEYGQQAYKLDTAGRVSVVGSLDGGWSLNRPQGLALDDAGNLYVSDAGQHGSSFMTQVPPRVLKLTASGVRSVVAGTLACEAGVSNCLHGFSGDGGPASSAALGASPRGLFWDPASGNLHLADAGTNRIRAIRVTEPTPLPFTFAAQADVALSATVVSATATPNGYTAPATVTVSGGEYSIGCSGTFTAEAGTLQPGQSLCVRHTASPVNNATVVTRLAVGNRTASFESTTLTGPGSVTLGATSLDFGAQSMNTTTPGQALVLTNPSAFAVTLNSVTVPAGFTVRHDCTTLAPGASCTLTIEFTPGAAGVLGGDIVLQLSPGNQTVRVSGTGEKSLTTHYYRTILQRDPDAAGKAFWDGEAARLAALGANPNEAWFALAMSFYFSPEYAAFGRTDEQFVADLYRTFFNRPPDDGGRSFWIGQLAGRMPREVLLAAFMFSPEFVAFAKAIFGDTAARAEVDVVMDFYRGLLVRLPDTEGFNHWVGRFRAVQCANRYDYAAMRDGISAETEAISSEFGTSAEYLARKRSNAQFVGDLYNAFFRRGGDLPGVLYWIGQLDSGALTRDQVRGHFKRSLEFQLREYRLLASSCYTP